LRGEIYTQGGQLICRTLDAWRVQSRKAYDRQKGLCEECHGEAPFCSRWIRGVRVLRGQAWPRRSRIRDDRAFNLRWLCCRCVRLAAKKRTPRRTAPVLEATYP